MLADMVRFFFMLFVVAIPLNKPPTVVFRQVFLPGARWKRKDARVAFRHDWKIAGKYWIFSRYIFLIPSSCR
jgi:hypothetical protein